MQEEDNGTATEPEDEEVVWAEPETPPKPSGILRALILLVVILLPPILAVKLTVMSGKASSGDAVWMQIEILPQVSPDPGGSSDQEPWHSVQPDMETEIAWLRSSEVLRRVVEDQALDKALNFRNKQDAANWLHDRLSVNHAGGRVVDVGVKYFDQEFGKGLVASIVDSYANSREETRRDSARKMIEALMLEAMAAEALTEQARIDMFDSLGALKTVDLAPWDSPEIETPMIRAARLGQLELTPEQTTKLEKERRMLGNAVEAKREYVTARTQRVELETAISRAQVAAKLPRQHVLVLSDPGQGQPRLTPSGWSAPLAMLAGLPVGMFIAVILMFLWSAADRQRATRS